MKFFQYQNRLGVIAIEPDAIAATVIGNATDILYLMLPKNTPCLAGAGGTEQIVNFQFPELLGKRFAFQIIPQLVDLLRLETKRRIFFYDLSCGKTFFYIPEQLVHLG